MKQYKFTSGDIDEIVEELGYKRAVKKFQGSHKDLKEVNIKWTTKRGREVTGVQKLPMKAGSKW